MFRQIVTLASCARVLHDARMTPYEHKQARARALEIIDFMEDVVEIEHDGRTITISTPAEDRIEAEAHAHALVADAELLGVGPREHAADVLVSLTAVFEAEDDTDAERGTLCRILEGAALVYLGRLT